MHIAGIGAEPYGPALPCCADASAAASSALVGGSGPACDPNCVTPAGSLTQAQIDRIASQVDVLTQQAQVPVVVTSQWFSGVSNTVVIAAGVGLGAILFLKGRR